MSKTEQKCTSDKRTAISHYQQQQKQKKWKKKKKNNNNKKSKNKTGGSEKKEKKTNGCLAGFSNFSLDAQLINKEWGLGEVVANVLLSVIVVNNLEFKSLYCVLFRTNTLGKGMNCFFLFAIS